MLRHHRNAARLRPARVAAFVAVVLCALCAGSLSPAAAAPTAPAAGTSPSPSPAVKKATFGIEPASSGKPDGRPSLQVGGTPFGTFSDQVAIVNRSVKAYTFDVYTTDMVSDSSGAPALPAVDAEPIDAGTWITLGGAAASGKVTVQPGAYVTFPIEGRIPGNASPGDHLAAIVVDLPTPGKRGNLNVLLHQRVGLSTFIRVAGDARPGLAIENLSTGYHPNWNPVGGGGATISYRIHNTGNFVLSTTQKVSISGIIGQTASVTPKAIPLLLPGARVDVEVPLSGVAPEVWMTAKVQLTPHILNDAGNPALGVEPISARTNFWAVPWVALGILVGLTALIVWFWRWRRKLRNSPGRHSQAKNGQRAGHASRSQRAKQEVGA